MKIWRLWSKALGEKASKCDKESDKIAMIRTVIFATYLITNVFIIAGVVLSIEDAIFWQDTIKKQGCRNIEIYPLF